MRVPGTEPVLIHGYPHIYASALRVPLPPHPWYPPPGPLGVAILVTVVTFGPMCRRRVSKVSTVTGIRVVLIAILATVIAFDTSYCCPSVKVVTVTDQLGRHLA